jgi:hypothetical protein
LAYIEIYVFRGNLFQAHSLEQSYHPTQPFKQDKYNTIPKYNIKNNIKSIYLAFVHHTNKQITGHYKITKTMTDVLIKAVRPGTLCANACYDGFDINIKPP